MNYESVPFHRSWRALPDVTVKKNGTTARHTLLHFSTESELLLRRYLTEV